jgi:antitoxin component YwqK of YwqJK toxin-antitoxin module
MMTHIKHLKNSCLFLIGLISFTNITAQNKQILNAPDSICEFNLLSSAKESNHKLSDENNYYWFRWGEIHNSQGSFSGTLLHGEYAVFYASKQLKVKGHLKYGLADDEWRFWNEEGKLLRIEHWKKGTLKEVVKILSQQEKNKLKKEKSWFKIWKERRKVKREIKQQQRYKAKVEKKKSKEELIISGDKKEKSALRKKWDAWFAKPKQKSEPKK